MESDVFHCFYLCLRAIGDQPVEAVFPIGRFNLDHRKESPRQVANPKTCRLPSRTNPPRVQCIPSLALVGIYRNGVFVCLTFSMQVSNHQGTQMCIRLEISCIVPNAGRKKDPVSTCKDEKMEKYKTTPRGASPLYMYMRWLFLEL